MRCRRTASPSTPSPRRSLPRTWAAAPSRSARTSPAPSSRWAREPPTCPAWRRRWPVGTRRRQVGGLIGRTAAAASMRRIGVDEQHSATAPPSGCGDMGAVSLLFLGARERARPVSKVEGDAMDQNVAKASAVTVLAAGLGIGGLAVLHNSQQLDYEGKIVIAAGNSQYYELAEQVQGGAAPVRRPGRGAAHHARSRTRKAAACCGRWRAALRCGRWPTTTPASPPAS